MSGRRGDHVTVTVTYYGENNIFFCDGQRLRVATATDRAPEGPKDRKSASPVVDKKSV